MLFAESEPALRVGAPRMIRRILALGVLASVACASPADVAIAQTKYPERPIRIIVPYVVGGIGDLTARLVADKLAAKLGQRVVVDNMPGAGGATAAHATLAAPPDGYTITLFTNITAINVQLFKHLSFDPLKDFAPISGVGYFDGVFATSAAAPYKTLADFLAAVREKPGTLNVGTISVGSTQNLSAQLLKSMTGANFVIIPFRTSPETIAALMRNDIQMIVDFPPALKAGLADHKLLPVAATGPVSAHVLGGIPTVAQAGVPNYEVTSWNALYASAATPRTDIEVLNAALQDVLIDPEIKQRAADLGLDTHATAPAEIDARMRADIEKWGRLIEQAHIPQQ
jgi:tripartite-type tricarboxylate transporter receptor subunit TctC